MAAASALGVLGALRAERARFDHEVSSLEGGSDAGATAASVSALSSSSSFAGGGVRRRSRGEGVDDIEDVVSKLVQLQNIREMTPFEGAYEIPTSLAGVEVAEPEQIWHDVSSYLVASDDVASVGEAKALSPARRYFERVLGLIQDTDNTIAKDAYWRARDDPVASGRTSMASQDALEERRNAQADVADIIELIMGRVEAHGRAYAKAEYAADDDAIAGGPRVTEPAHAARPGIPEAAADFTPSEVGKEIRRQAQEFLAELDVLQRIGSGVVSEAPKAQAWQDFPASEAKPLAIPEGGDSAPTPGGAADVPPPHPEPPAEAPPSAPAAPPPESTKDARPSSPAPSPPDAVPLPLPPEPTSKAAPPPRPPSPSSSPSPSPPVGGEASRQGQPKAPFLCNVLEEVRGGGSGARKGARAGAYGAESGAECGAAEMPQPEHHPKGDSLQDRMGAWMTAEREREREALDVRGTEERTEGIYAASAVASAAHRVASLLGGPFDYDAIGAQCERASKALSGIRAVLTKPSQGAFERETEMLDDFPVGHPASFLDGGAPRSLDSAAVVALNDRFVERTIRDLFMAPPVTTKAGRGRGGATSLAFSENILLHQFYDMPEPPEPASRPPAPNAPANRVGGGPQRRRNDEASLARLVSLLARLLARLLVRL